MLPGALKGCLVSGPPSPLSDRPRWRHWDDEASRRVLAERSCGMESACPAGAAAARCASASNAIMFSGVRAASVVLDEKLSESRPTKWFGSYITILFAVGLHLGPTCRWVGRTYRDRQGLRLGGGITA